MIERASLSPAELSDLIGLIYDCALDSSRWTETLLAIREQLGFHNAFLELLDLPSGRPRLSILTGLEQVWIERQAQWGDHVIDLWGGAATIQRLSNDQPAVLTWVNERANWGKNPYYENWAKPQGLIDVLGITLMRSTDMVGSLAMGRHESAGEIGQWEVDMAKLLIPHLQRAIAISKLLDLNRIAADNHKLVLDALTVGVVMVEADLSIIHANKAAQAMLAIGDPIGNRSAKLTLRSQPAAEALRRAVSSALDEGSIGRRGFGIPVSFADGTPCLIHVLPLQSGTLRLGLSPHAAAAVFIAPTSLQLPAPDEALAALFDLTSAEARVFTLIAGGKTPLEAAQVLGISQGTVRTHLVRIFAKTGTHRQADLVRLATSLSLPL